MTVAVDGVERYRWPVSSGLPSYETPNGSFRAFRMEAGPLLQGIRRRADAAFDLLHQEGHAIHGTDSVSRLGSPGLAWLRAAVARQCLEALCAGAGARRAQHHGDADRLVAGRIGAQSAAAHQHRRRPPRPGAAIRTADTDAAGDPVVLAPQAARGAAGRAPMTAISIRPTAVPARRAIRRRATAASTAPRPIRSRSSNIMTTAAMPRRRRAITTSRSHAYQPRGLFTYQD